MNKGFVLSMAAQIASSQVFMLARDKGIGDYSHGQTISYYGPGGHLVKRDHRVVLLWSNSGKPFDKTTYMTFKPKIVLHVNEKGDLCVDPDILQKENTNNSVELDIVPVLVETNVVETNSVEIANPRINVRDVLLKSIQPPLKKQHIEAPTKPEIEEIEVVNETQEQQDLDINQSDIQEIDIKVPPKEDIPKKKKKQTQQTSKKGPRRNPPRKVKKKRRKTSKKGKKVKKGKKGRK